MCNMISTSAKGLPLLISKHGPCVGPLLHASCCGNLSQNAKFVYDGTHRQCHKVEAKDLDISGTKAFGVRVLGLGGSGSIKVFNWAFFFVMQWSVGGRTNILSSKGSTTLCSNCTELDFTEVVRYIRAGALYQSSLDGGSLIPGRVTSIARNTAIM